MPVCIIVQILNVMGLTDTHFKFFALERRPMWFPAEVVIEKKIDFLEGM